MSALAVQLFDSVLDLLVPAECVGCDTPRTQLCGGCRAELASCRPFPARPDGAAPGLPEVYAALPYAGPVRQVLLAHKERGALRMAAPLGAALAAAVRCAVPGPRGPLLLIPMPSSAAAVRARGHDATLRLARAAASSLRGSGVPARVLPALRQRPGVADQAGLGAAERHRNLAGALTVRARYRRALATGHVLLLDDLITTGSTLTEATRALSTAGADVLAAAVVAATRRRA